MFKQGHSYILAEYNKFKHTGIMNHSIADRLVKSNKKPIPFTVNKIAYASADSGTLYDKVTSVILHSEDSSYSTYMVLTPMDFQYFKEVNLEKVEGDIAEDESEETCDLSFVVNGTINITVNSESSRLKAIELLKGVNFEI